MKGEPKNHYIKVEKKSKIHELKEKLAQRSGIAVDRLLLADVYHGRIFQMLNDEASVNAIRDTDVTYAYVPQWNNSYHTHGEIYSYEVMQEDDPGIKKVRHLQMVQRVHEKRSSFDSFDSFGFPVLLSVPV